MELVTAYLAYELIAQRHDADRQRMHAGAWSALCRRRVVDEPSP
jgi:hypothetical protein